MLSRFKQYTLSRPLLKKYVGWFFVIFGFVMLVTPLTPGGSLFFVGLELVGIRIVATQKFLKLFSKKEILPISIPVVTQIETAQ